MGKHAQAKGTMNDQSERIHNDDIYAVLYLNQFPLEFAIKYLNIFVGFADWKPSLGLLWKRVKGDREAMREAVSCALMLPVFDRSTHIDKDHPENLLNKILWYAQLKERNWFEQFQKVVKRDEQVDRWRMQALTLGVIRPFEYAPTPRQAYNWMYTKAEESGAITSPHIKQDVSDRFKNLVEAYGGEVICNIFSRHEETLKRIVNWRTSYFFERNIYIVYEPEQVFKIKEAELNRTNPTLVKKIRFI